MDKIRHFEELDCWQKARSLANSVFYLTSKSSFGKDYRLRDQIQAAAGSAMHNIAAGFDSGTDLDFIRSLKIARRFASEVQSELYLAMDRKYVTADELAHAYELAGEVKRVINKLLSDLQDNHPDNSAYARGSTDAGLTESAGTNPSEINNQNAAEPVGKVEAEMDVEKRPRTDGGEINYYRPNDYEPDGPGSDN